MWPPPKSPKKIYQNIKTNNTKEFRNFIQKKIDFIHVKMWEKEDGVRNFEIT